MGIGPVAGPVQPYQGRLRYRDFSSVESRRAVSFHRDLAFLAIDLALLQEACMPPPDVAERIQADPAIEVDTAPWETTIVGGRAKFRTAIVKLSNRIEIDCIEAKSTDTAEIGDLVVSSPGTFAAAFVTLPSGSPW